MARPDQLRGEEKRSLREGESACVAMGEVGGGHTGDSATKWEKEWGQEPRSILTQVSSC